MFYVRIGSASIINVRQIQRHLASKINILSRNLFVFFAGNISLFSEVRFEYFYTLINLVLSGESFNL